MRVIPILLLTSVLAACATEPVPTSEARDVPGERLLANNWTKPQRTTGTIIVKRDAGVIGSPCYNRVFVNGTPVADLAAGEKVTLHLPAGDHILSARPHEPCGSRLAETGTQVRTRVERTYRLGYGSNGDFFISPTAF